MKSGFHSIKSLLLMSCLGGILLSSSVTVLAEEPGVDRIMFTPQQREEINQQRLQYLKSQQVGDVKVEEEKKVEPPKKVVRKGPYRPPNPMLRKLEVSAVIERPDGSKSVRINKQYYEQPSKKIPYDPAQTSVDGVVLENRNKQVSVPVGSTYFSRSNKTVENYQLQKSAKASKPERAILKSTNQNVKETLKDVKTVTRSDKQ